jgi:hypothetical protein
VQRGARNLFKTFTQCGLAQKIVIFEKLPKVNNRTLGEDSPNQVNLIVIVCILEFM